MNSDVSDLMVVVCMGGSWHEDGGEPIYARRDPVSLQTLNRVVGERYRLSKHYTADGGGIHKYMAGSSIVLTELHRQSTTWVKIVDEIVSLEKKTFPEHEPLDRSIDDELKKKNSGLIYLEINGDLAGYVMYSCPSSLCAIIIELAVKENYRRQGHGDALLKAVIEKCRSKRIHVDPLRAPAINLYKKLGFQIDTLLKGYYSADRDAYRMYIDFDTD